MVALHRSRRATTSISLAATGLLLLTACTATDPAAEDTSAGSSSGSDAGVTLVRDWGNAGFPSPSEKPEWYCAQWTDKDTQEANRIAQIKDNPGWEWKVEDKLNRELGLPRAVLVITGPESSQNATPEVTYYVSMAPNNGNWCLGSLRSSGAIG